MEDNRIIKITTENGKEVDAEVLDIFGVEGFDHDYCLYTFGEDKGDDNQKVYVSIIKEKDDGFDFIAITDEEEWQAVQEALNEPLESGEE